MIDPSTMSFGAERIGWVLIHFLWQGAAIAVVFAIGRRWGFRNPRARYRFGCLALASLVLAPIVTAVVLLGPSPALVADRSSPALLGAAASPSSGWSWLVATWLAGVIAMTVRTARGWLGIRRLLADASDYILPPALRRVVERFGLRRRVRFLQSHAVGSPATVGWFRPVILLPTAMLCRLNVAELEAIVAHELAHVRRFDYLVNLVQVASETLLFFHPAVWWISRSIRIEREYCCDDQAVIAVGDPLHYATALTRVAELHLALATTSAKLAPAATGGSLVDRVRRLLDGGGAPPPRAASWWAISAVAVGVATIGLACLTPEGSAPGTDHGDHEMVASVPAETDATDGARTWDWLPDEVSRWAPQVQAAAERHGVDPELLAIFVWVESRGQPAVQSPMGAVGLMQVMPATAKEIARARGLPEPDEQALRDPELSLDLGAWLVARELQQFRVADDPLRSVELAAAAYNAGPRRVRAHLGQDAPLRDETTLYSAKIRQLYGERSDARENARKPSKSPAP